MKADRICGLFIATLLLAALFSGLGCGTGGLVPAELSTLNGIRADRAIRPAPADTLLAIPADRGGLKTTELSADLYDIPVPPDRRFGASELFFYHAGKDSVIEVLKTSVSEEGLVKIFKGMKTGDQYLLIRVRSASAN
jgi:hypothetical protein